MPDGVFQDVHAKELYISGGMLSVSNSGAVVIDGDTHITGKVGIGTTSPNQKLEIESNNSGGTSNPLNILRFTDIDLTGATNQRQGQIEFYTSDSTAPGVHSKIYGMLGGVSGEGNLVFATGVGGSAAERFRITSLGILNIKENTTHPATNPSGEGNLFVSGGALVYLGTSGTTTVVGAA